MIFSLNFFYLNMFSASLVLSHCEDFSSTSNDRLPWPWSVSIDLSENKTFSASSFVGTYWYQCLRLSFYTRTIEEAVNFSLADFHLHIPVCVSLFNGSLRNRRKLAIFFMIKGKNISWKQFLTYCWGCRQSKTFTFCCY